MQLPEEISDTFLQRDEIPDNTLFFSIWSGFSEREAAHHMVKFKGDFYAFDSQDVLYRLPDDHSFREVSSFNKIMAENIQEYDMQDLWKQYIGMSVKTVDKHGSK